MPDEIAAPHYATTGARSRRGESMVKDADVIERMRRTGRGGGRDPARGRRRGRARRSPPTSSTCSATRPASARGGYPSPLNYGGFPKSVCTSVNEVICHGIPDDRALRDGDIVNIDVTLFREGVHGDTNATFFVGTVDAASAPPRRHHPGLPRAGHRRGRARPARSPTSAGPSRTTPTRPRLAVVRAFIGHGVGTEFHTAPEILHYYDPRAATVMQPGMTFTIEPMIAAGRLAAPHVGRRLDRGHRRRSPLGPVRAHASSSPTTAPRSSPSTPTAPGPATDSGSELAGVGLQAEAEAADRFEGAGGDHGVLGGDVHVAEHPLQRARLVDRRAAAGGVAGGRRLGGGRRRVGRGEPQRAALLVADRVAGARTEAHASPTVSSTSARALRSAASARATSACTGARSASARLDPCGTFPPARATSSSRPRRPRPSATDATPSASMPKKEKR